MGLLLSDWFEWQTWDSKCCISTDMMLPLPDVLTIEEWGEYLDPDLQLWSGWAARLSYVLLQQPGMCIFAASLTRVMQYANTLSSLSTGTPVDRDGFVFTGQQPWGLCLTGWLVLKHLRLWEADLLTQPMPLYPGKYTGRDWHVTAFADIFCGLPGQWAGPHWGLFQCSILFSVCNGKHNASGTGLTLGVLVLTTFDTLDILKQAYGQSNCPCTREV